MSQTTALGLFNYAVSYLKSADFLCANEQQIKSITHPEAPVDFLYIHALEVFLKSYLRLDDDLTHVRSMNHKVFNMAKKAINRGIHISEQDLETIRLIDEYKLHSNTRYIVIRFTTNEPTSEDLAKVTQNIFQTVSKEFIRRGVLRSDYQQRFL